MSSDDESSSSSDDEYLTTTSKVDGQGKGSDREAMVRKKLLESFYGGSAGSATESIVPESPSRPSSKADKKIAEVKKNIADKMEDPTAATKSNLKHVRSMGLPIIRLSRNTTKDHVRFDNKSGTISNTDPNTAPSFDLDSPKFDPVLYSRAQFQNSSTLQLLETDERFTQEIRHLDSTMQTLVYENYSKFIEATEAVKSISRLSSTSSEEQLSRLAKGIDRIDRIARSMDDALRVSREAVAEKLRIKRLVSRLDALLKLPATLREHIAAERYRQGTKSYLEAIAILGQHSAGFESLRSIEFECQFIIRHMVDNLRKSIVLWSGATGRWKKSALNLSDECIKSFHEGTMKLMDDHSIEGANDSNDSNSSNTHRLASLPAVILSPHEAPKSLSEIYECVGALYMLSKGQLSVPHSKVLSFLTEKDCKILALESCAKHLQRILDDHAAELNRSKHTVSVVDGAAADQPTLELAPSSFLSSLLEAVTLFGIIFKKGKEYDKSDIQILNDFITKLFSSFLAHVRQGSLDWNSSNENADESDGSELFALISQASSLVLRAVRELAAALVLPDIGISEDVAKSLVQQTVGITEVVVQRRVAQRFDTLRVRVVKECLLPFIQESVSQNCVPEATADSSRNVIETIQMANSALSDCMQLVDDTISHMLPRIARSDVSTADSDLLKEAVRKNARSWSFWLAHCLETLSGYQDANCETLEIKLDESQKNGPESDSIVLLSVGDDGIAPVTSADKTTDHQDEIALADVCAYFSSYSSVQSCSVILLAIVEMCRLGARTVVTNINRSLVDEGTKNAVAKSDGLFSNPAKSASNNIDSDHLISKRFNLAASRSLVTYISTMGVDAAALGCTDLLSHSTDNAFEIPSAPSSWSCRILEIAKVVSVSCSSAFGGESFGGPVPRFSDADLKQLSIDAQIQSRHMAAAKSLHIDMFTQKVQIYPIPANISTFTRNFVVHHIFKITLKALREQCRLCTFTVPAYRQIQVDVEFLRRMTSHYVKDETGVEITELHQLLDELLRTAGIRCVDSECVDVAIYKDQKSGKTNTPTSICASFLESYKNLSTFIIDGVSA